MLTNWDLMSAMNSGVSHSNCLFDHDIYTAENLSNTRSNNLNHPQPDTQAPLCKDRIHWGATKFKESLLSVIASAASSIVMCATKTLFMSARHPSCSKNEGRIYSCEGVVLAETCSFGPAWRKTFILPPIRRLCKAYTKANLAAQGTF